MWFRTATQTLERQTFRLFKVLERWAQLKPGKQLHSTNGDELYFVCLHHDSANFEEFFSTKLEFWATRSESVRGSEKSKYCWRKMFASESTQEQEISPKKFDVRNSRNRNRKTFPGRNSHRKEQQIHRSEWKLLNGNFVIHGKPKHKLSWQQQP